MRIKQLLDRRAGYSLASLGLLLGLAAPAVVPAFASADQLSTRSITMSTSATGATAQYNIKFTTTTDIDIGGGVAIEFCSNTAVTGDSCTRPTGMNTSTSGTLVDVVSDGTPMTSDGTLDKNGPDDEEGSLLWTAAEAHSAGDTLEIIVGGIKNPTAVGVFYARVLTFESDIANVTTGYQGEEGTEVGSYSDEGSMALAATAGIGVTSYVLEAMSFCVSLGNVGDSDSGDDDAIAANEQPSENCGGDESDCVEDSTGSPDVQPGCVIAPSMTMGEDDGSGNIVLNSSKLFSGQIWAQLSSNANGNTVVNLKSDAADCGGLYRNGDPGNCDIPPQTTAGSIAAGTANFGLTVGAAAAAPQGDGNSGNGTGTIAQSGSYGASDYYIDFTDNDTAGVTSTYGSPVFSTTGAVDNMNVPITFGATISNNTPAGTYGANLSLIATGTF